MHDLAKELVSSFEPANGWWCEDTEEKLIEATLSLLEHFTVDDTEDLMRNIIGSMRAEYGE